MNILVKRAVLVDPQSPLHQQTTDLFIRNGVLTETGALSHKADHEIDIKGLHVAPGFADPFCLIPSPGHEYKESFETGAQAAAYGGYTDVMVLPNTSPAGHHRLAIETVMHRNASLPVTVHPIGAVTKNTEGKELAEMYDMQNAGAIAFSDGINPLQSAGLTIKALQYLRATNKILIQLPDDSSIAAHGLMNEGKISTQLGMPGKPALAEDLMVSRDINLAKYTAGAVHITGVSTAKALELIKAAKAEGVNITCSVSPFHLLFTDEDLTGYDTNLKLNPPLRTAADRDALIAALKDGTIDCIASHHNPQHYDQKVLEFEYAKPGMISLETAFAIVRTAVPDLSLERIVEIFSVAPRKIFGLAPASIVVGQPASLTLFLPYTQWTPTRFYSKSKNSALLGRQLTGLPLGIIHKDRLFLKPQS